MSFRGCAWETEITQALSAGHWPNASGLELRTHVETCPRCSDLVLVTETIPRARTASVLAEHPMSPSWLWWRAQLRRRNYAAEQMSQPISFANTFAWLVSGLLTVVFVMSQYQHGLGWGLWWSQINAAHVLSLWSLAVGHLQWKLYLVIPIVGVLLLLSGNRLLSGTGRRIAFV
jgi:hypothetical protein